MEYQNQYNESINYSNSCHRWSCRKSHRPVKLFKVTFTGLRRGSMRSLWSLTRLSARSCICQGNSKYKYRLGEELIVSSPEENLEVLVGEKLHVTQQCACADQEPTHILGCIQSSAGSRVREMILPLCSALFRWEPTCSTAASSGDPNVTRTQTCWSDSKGRQCRWTEGWNTSPMKTCWEMGLFNLEKIKVSKEDLSVKGWKGSWSGTFYKGTEW